MDFTLFIITLWFVCVKLFSITYSYYWYPGLYLALRLCNLLTNSDSCQNPIVQWIISFCVLDTCFFIWGIYLASNHCKGILKSRKCNFWSCTRRCTLDQFSITIKEIDIYPTRIIYCLECNINAHLWDRTEAAFSFPKKK